MIEKVAPGVREIEERIDRNWNNFSIIKKKLEKGMVSGKKRKKLGDQAESLSRLIAEDEIRLTEVIFR